MFKTILVPVNGVDKDEIVLGAALAAGRLFNSHLEVMRVRLGPAALVWEGELIDVSAGLLSGDLVKMLDSQAQERTARAHAAFTQFCARENIAIAQTPPGPEAVSAAWREIRGSQTDELIAHARLHDLVVVEKDLLRETTPSADLAGRMVLHCGRPVLVVHDPVAETFAHTVAIAWKDTAETARAVAMAMPFLAKAKDVILLIGDEDEDGTGAATAAASTLVQTLGWHGIAAKTETVSLKGRKPAHALADAAGDAGAGLLVAGAYGHQRTRELVFGGFTQDVLDYFPIPALLSH